MQTLKNLKLEKLESFPFNESFQALLAMVEKAPPTTNKDVAKRAAMHAYRTGLLEKCNPRSVMAAVLQIAQLGLDPVMGEVYLAPSGSNCQVIPGYLGLMKLARNSGFISDIYAHEVRARDHFRIQLGLERKLEHIPYPGKGFPAPEEGGDIVGFYAVAILRDNQKTFAAMSRREVERVRDKSPGYQAAKRQQTTSVWDTDFAAMGLKTVVRRLCKFLPKSAELEAAMALDTLPESRVMKGKYTPEEVSQGSQSRN